MNSYSYTEQLFTSVLKQSARIQGRFFVIPKSGSELNSDDLEQVTNLATPNRKYPLCAMTPPKSSGDFAGNDEWEEYIFTLFFLNTTFFDGNNQGKDINKNTQTSQHKVIQDWDEMKQSAVDFLRILDKVQKGNNSTGTSLINLVFRLAKEKKYIDPVSFQTTHRLSGVRLSFKASVFVGCTIQDYTDSSLIVVPSFSN